MTDSKMFLLKLKLSECAVCLLMLGRVNIQVLAQRLDILPGFFCFRLSPQTKAGITSIHAMTASFFVTKRLALN
jgi:hypothetical protein